MRRFLTSSILICLCATVRAEAPTHPDFGMRTGESAAVVANSSATLESRPTIRKKLRSDVHDGGRAAGFEHAPHVYRAAAARGDAVAQFELGKMYAIGAGVGQDEAWAITYYRAAAQQGHQQAARNLANLYRASGLAAPASARPAQDETPSVISLDKSTLPQLPRGHAAISTALVNTLRATDVPLVADSNDEADALKLALAHGIAIEHAKRTIGKLQTDTVNALETVPDVTLSGGVDARYEAAKAALARGKSASAIRTLRQLAGDGHAEAALSLATLAERSGAWRKDKSTALGWWQRAAQLGSAEAQFKLGVSHLHGAGIVRDEAMAITFLRSAASAGHVGAREKLRGLYRDAGIAFPRFPTAARRPSTSDLQLFPADTGNSSLGSRVPRERPIAYAEVSVELFREFATLRQIRVGRPGEVAQGPNYVPLTRESLLKDVAPRANRENRVPQIIVPEAGASETTSMKGRIRSSFMLTAVILFHGGIPAGEIADNLLRS